ncbi:MAG: right-handed parallel beta-helix repeat-containing protein, partial [Lachnospiraceae bacterium]|nr:right-handed parallel beta-helix repeat-containing protein [Lachnospiraceae bacterium]
YEGMESGKVPGAKTIITVTVKGINNYADSEIKGEYCIYKTSISKLKVTIDAKEYTGKEILLSTADIHVYANSTDAKKKQNEIENCYEILEGEYKNNIKAGTAKVTLRGTGDYGGTKTYSFKIKKKTYLINQVKGITLDKTSLALSIQGKDDDKRILKATIKSADETEPLANPTVIWSTSNSNIAAVEGGDIVVTKTNTGKYETTVTAHIILKKEGSVTITATAQDSGKKAKCTVTIVDVPILIDADQPIKMKVNGTHKLRFENDDIQEPNLSGITWTISNSDVVSVDKEKGIITAEEAGAVMLKLTKGKYIQRCYVVVGGEEEDVPDTYLRFTQTPGSTDDTEDIRNCIKKANHTKNGDGTFKYDGVYIPAGVYWIDATANANCGIFLDGRDPSVTWDPLEARDSFEVRMSPGALLMTIGNSESSDFHVIKIEGCSNITISGGTIIGERNEHSGKSGESGHGIGIYDCTNIHIQDMDISQCWGDGIYLGRSYKSTADNKDIDIRHCNVHDNRRNNLSITSANGVTIDDCKFNNAKGKDPQFGIDIETNIDSKPCKNITISNTKMIGNAKASMGIITPAENIRLEYCTLSGNFYNKAGKNVVLYHTTVKGEIVGNVDSK